MARKRRAVEAEVWVDLPDQGAAAVLKGRLAVAEALAVRYGVEPPSLCQLRPLLLDLPPLVARDAVQAVLGVPVASKTLSNHDASGTGPRLRFQVAGRVVYPAAFLLEWLERQGMVPVAVQEV